MAEETTEGVKIPLYYDRFQEERDKRISSELGHLETMIGHNAERIADLHSEMNRRFGELEAEMDRRFEEAKADRDRRFGEAKTDRDDIRRQLARLEDKVDNHFRWTIGLLLPIIFGILAIIIRVFFLGPLP